MVGDLNTLTLMNVMETEGFLLSQRLGRGVEIISRCPRLCMAVQCWDDVPVMSYSLSIPRSHQTHIIEPLITHACAPVRGPLMYATSGKVTIALHKVIQQIVTHNAE